MSRSTPNELITDVKKPLLLNPTMLSQAEGLHTDFHTINFMRAICRDITVAPHGQRLYNNCFSNLPMYRSADERLQFGWGDRHMLRNLGVQLYEYEHLLLASALGEILPEKYTAAIFGVLGDGFEDEDRPKPHMSSFRGFAHGANGILSVSEFPSTVDDRIRMNPHCDLDRGMPFARQPSEIVPVAKIAQALCMLAQLRDEKCADLTIYGGDMLGWFSAFADLCLGVDVTLLDEDGQELHRANNDRSARLKLVFTRTHTPEKDLDGRVVWLRDGIDQKNHVIPNPPILTGRVTEHSMFNKVFGTAFHRLDQTESTHFGNALGGGAKLWDIMAHDEGLDESMISRENRSNENAVGIGLVQTWSNWFPELRHLQGRMERGLRKDKPGAMKQCDEAASHLEHVCGCFICSATQGSEENPTNLPKDGFCLPTVMETIMMLGLSLSRITLTPNLYVSRAGILATYKSQLQKRLKIKRTHAGGDDRYKILFGYEWNASLSNRLASAVALFSGSWPAEEELPENLVAISHEGMCAYAMKLERGNLNCKPHPDDSTIRVVSGAPCWRQKIFSRICLGPVQCSTNDIEGNWESFQCSHLKEPLFAK